MIYCWLSIIENDENGPSCCGFSFSNRNEPNSAEDFGFFGFFRLEIVSQCLIAALSCRCWLARWRAFMAAACHCHPSYYENPTLHIGVR